MIIGIGVDTVDIARFERQLERTPKLRERLFADTERGLSIPSLAARFAAKEALIKALGDSHGLGWHDMVVARGQDRAPVFRRGEALAGLLEALAAERVHLSMTHDAGVATAFVVVEAAEGAARSSTQASASEERSGESPGGPSEWWMRESDE